MKGLVVGSGETTATWPRLWRLEHAGREREAVRRRGQQPLLDVHRRDHVELDVGRVEPVARAQEAAALGRVGGQRAGALGGPQREVLLVSASLRLTGSSNIHVKPAVGWSWRPMPTPGTSATSGTCSSASSSGRPMPDSISSCGDGRRPRETMTSRSARNSSSSLSREPTTPTARVPSKRTRWAWTWVSTVRFGRSITGCR